MKTNERDRGEQRFVTVIAASRERVWEALTSPEFTSRYWHATRVRSNWQPGDAVEFLLEGDEAGCRGEVIESRPAEFLSYTWSFPRNPAVRDEAPSRVSFSLETISNEHGISATRLTVVHDRFPAGSRMPDMVGPGWPLVLAGLKTLLETGTSVDYSSMT